MYLYCILLYIIFDKKNCMKKVNNKTK